VSVLPGEYASSLGHLDLDGGAINQYYQDIDDDSKNPEDNTGGQSNTMKGYGGVKGGRT